MINLKILFCVLTIVALAFGSCEDNLLNERNTIGDKTSGSSHGGPDEESAGEGGWNYPYPDIIKKEYIPRNSDFAHTKCLAWRITWPEYPVSADADKIPTVFSVGNGALNSFEFLNNTSPQNTYNATFSLFYNFRLQSVNSMWTELDWADVGFEYIESVQFAESNMALDDIIDVVTGRPSLFETYWPKLESPSDEVDYNEGDFFQFRLSPSDLYGGIRIVSMTPRIIEVYLAVPNE